MSEFSVAEVLASRRHSDVDLWGRTINPQFARVLKRIGFDRRWARAEGAYLWDTRGDKYLDMLGGFGMFNVGRNNPRIRAALVEALALDLPGSVQLGASPLPPLLADELIRRTPARLERVLFTSSGTEAVEAALKLGRAATGRTRVEVPKAALTTRDGKTGVFLVQGDRVVFRPVVVGADRSASAEIKEGLAGGETLVADAGHVDLVDGAKVKIGK